MFGDSPFGADPFGEEQPAPDSGTPDEPTGDGSLLLLNIGRVILAALLPFLLS